MAAFDSLLKLIAVQRADELVLASGEVPLLRKAEEDLPLSMPRLDAELVDGFLRLALTPAERSALGSGPVETSYQTGAGEAFVLRVELRPGGVRLRFRPGAARSVAVTSALSSQPARPQPPPPFAPPPAVAGAHAASRSPVTERAAAATPPPAAGRAAVAPPLRALLERVAEERASDLLLSSGCDARLRLGGELVLQPGTAWSEEELRAQLAPLLDEGHLRVLEASGSVDLGVPALEGGQPRFRLNVFRQQLGLAAAFRPIHQTLPTLRQLNLPEHLHELTAFPHGLVLITGPSSSGKSTTLVALVEQLNATRARHVITLEDPIEYQYAPRRSLIHQREVGVHVESFDAGLRAALRESPDVIVVGEMRDLPTIAAALTAAETGHLVLSSLHCSSAAVAIDRIVDVFPEQQQTQVRVQLAGVLRAVVTQFLLPAARPPGRYPALEKLVVTDAVAVQIRENKCHLLASLIQTGRAAGMVPLDRSLAELVRAGRVTAEAAATVARAPAELAELHGR